MNIDTRHAKTPASMERNCFDFLRFCLASLVIFSHSFPLATGSESAEPLAMLTHGHLTFGALAVDGFFIISGFLIAHSWVRKPSMSVFLWKRAARIYPGFLVVALFGAFVVAPLVSAEGYAALTPRFVAALGLNLLRLNAYTPGRAFADNPYPDAVNGSLWSIPYEFWCYLGVLALGVSGLLYRRTLLAAALGLSLAVSLVFEWRGLTPGGAWLGKVFGYPPTWARLLPFFLSGMAFYVYREVLKPKLHGASLALLALLVATQFPLALTLVLPMAAAYLIFWLAFVPLPVLHDFARHGDFSYGIYLYAFPLAQLTVFLSETPMTPWRLFAIVWPLAVLAGILSWHLVEKHWLARRSRNPRTAASDLPALLGS